MIRFVDLTEAECGPGPCFAFFDTVTNRFVELLDEQVWDSAEDLTEAHEAAVQWLDSMAARELESRFIPPPDLDRLLRLIPPGWPPSAPARTEAQKQRLVTAEAKRAKKAAKRRKEAGYAEVP